MVADISTMAEGDPRIPDLLHSLRELPEAAVVKELTKHFDSDKHTVRRAAIYIAWKGEFADASATVVVNPSCTGRPQDALLAYSEPLGNCLAGRYPGRKPFSPDGRLSGGATAGRPPWRQYAARKCRMP